MTFSTCIKSFRLRTLPLSLSGVILGGAMAGIGNNPLLFTFIVLTTLSLQILTNLSNELGDALKGTDSEQEGRAQLGMQSGLITVAQMKLMIYLFVSLCVVFGGLLIYFAFTPLWCWQSLLFALLGVAAIWAAMRYTLGENAYGYRGWGDLAVLVFFGWLGVMGSYYLMARTINLDVFLAATAIGLPIVGVLNVNNIRDMPNDIKHGKITFASRVGTGGARYYHLMLICGSLMLFSSIKMWAPLLMTPALAYHLWFMYTHSGAELDKQMAFLSLTTLGMSLCYLVYSLVC